MIGGQEQSRRDARTTGDGRSFPSRRQPLPNLWQRLPSLRHSFKTGRQRLPNLRRSFVNLRHSLTNLSQSLPNHWQPFKNLSHSLPNLWQSFVHLWQPLPNLWQRVPSDAYRTNTRPTAPPTPARAGFTGRVSSTSDNKKDSPRRHGGRGEDVRITARRPRHPSTWHGHRARAKPAPSSPPRRPPAPERQRPSSPRDRRPGRHSTRPPPLRCCGERRGRRTGG
jgi:hypothetical protein